MKRKTTEFAARRLSLRPMESLEDESILPGIDRSKGPVELEAPPLRVILPHRVFLYTLDQLAYMLQISIEDLSNYLIWFTGLTPGKSTHKMIAVNITTDPARGPDWRVTEEEFIEYLRRTGFRAGRRKIIEQST